MTAGRVDAQYDVRLFASLRINYLWRLLDRARYRRREQTSVAQYKYEKFLQNSDHAAYDATHEPGVKNRKRWNLSLYRVRA
jgi:hypothetical protein